MAITPIVDATGIHAPAFSDILSALQDAFRGIYGSDVNLDNDSQDGQLLGVFAKAIFDANAVTVSVYNAFSPATAQGAGLSSVVKVNGIARAVASRSTVDVLIVGQAGTTIANGVVTDISGNRWDLPASVVIPPAGQIIATATAEALGAITAPAGTVTAITTPTRGWQTVTNPSAATPGAPVETDAALRLRQTVSVALPSRTVLEGTIGAVALLKGVTRFKAYENDTSLPDSNGLPPHSISLVIDGGDAFAIAQTIADKKGPGCDTFGNTTEIVTNAFGLQLPISFSRPAQVPIEVAINITALPGFSTSIGGEIVAAVVAYINGLAIGGASLAGGVHGVPWMRILVPAQLKGEFANPASPNDGDSFELTSLTIARQGGAPGQADIPLAFNEAAFTSAALVTLTVT